MAVLMKVYLDKVWFDKSEFNIYQLPEDCDLSYIQPTINIEETTFPSTNYNRCSQKENSIKKIGKMSIQKDTMTLEKRKIQKNTKTVSAYALFFRDVQENVRITNPQATFGDISKIVANMWENLGDSLKKKYKKETDDRRKSHLQSLAFNHICAVARNYS
uniref:HMG box domain-containing protein n=1 Tax=Rhabditophanes sp. KR3021 TaxID=114890 RepID=A0AC35U0X4_9BILA